jgi:hypothetical protein
VPFITLLLPSCFIANKKIHGVFPVNGASAIPQIEIPKGWLDQQLSHVMGFSVVSINLFLAAIAKNAYHLGSVKP